MEIRKVRVDDYKEICRVNRESLGYDFPLDKTKEKLEYITSRPYYVIYVAVDENDKAVAYIQAQEYETTYLDNCINVLGLTVLNEYQGKGIGKALMTKLEEYAKKNGVKLIRLTSGMNRTEAHKFYEHIGFELTKTQKNYRKYLE